MTRRTPPTNKDREGQLAIRFAVALLTLPRFTRAEFAAAARVSRGTASRFIGTLHDAGHLHIDEWLYDSCGRHAIAVFAAGREKDAPRKRSLHGKAKALNDKARRMAVADAALGAALRKMARSMVETEEVS